MNKNSINYPIMKESNMIVYGMFQAGLDQQTCLKHAINKQILILHLVSFSLRKTSTTFWKIQCSLNISFCDRYPVCEIHIES